MGKQKKTQRQQSRRHWVFVFHAPYRLALLLPSIAIQEDDGDDDQAHDHLRHRGMDARHGHAIRRRILTFPCRQGTGKKNLRQKTDYFQGIQKSYSNFLVVVWQNAKRKREDIGGMGVKIEAMGKCVQE